VEVNGSGKHYSLLYDTATITAVKSFKVETSSSSSEKKFFKFEKNFFAEIRQNLSSKINA
jgi:hypothetical protein